MASQRPHLLYLGIDAAWEEISKIRGLLYDSEVVDTCLRLFNDRGYEFESGIHKLRDGYGQLRVSES